MQKLRVLHVVRHLGGGGIESFLCEVSSVLKQHFDLNLHSWCNGLTYGEPPWPNADASAIVGSVAQARSLLRTLRTWQPDIVHCHAPEVFLFTSALLLASRSRSRTISHIHQVLTATGSRTPLGWVFGKLAHARCRKVIACSHVAADQLRSDPRIAAEKLCVLYNPVNTSAFEGSSANEAFRTAANAHGGGLLGVFLGRLDTRVKGLDVLCEAVRLLPQDLPLQVALVGPGDRAGVRRQLQPPESVVLTGPVDRADVPGILRAADIYLQPSRSEGLGLSIIEAMAAGLPVIATRVGGIPEAVEDGVTGILVAPDDPRALADAIRWMLDHPAERAAMGERGAGRSKLFDVHTIAGHLEAIYREVAND